MKAKRKQLALQVRRANYERMKKVIGRRGGLNIRRPGSLSKGGAQVKPQGNTLGVKHK